MARVLIVDDSIIMRRNLTAILKEVGHTIVSEASNGTQAYLQYRIHKPDIVTMDITMPNMDGIDALKQIIEEDPSARIIMISALDQKSKIYTALRSGAKHYIIKPLTAEKITNVIDSVMAESQTDVSFLPDTKEEVQAFNVVNDEGEFIILFQRSITAKDTIELTNIIQGFLYLDKPILRFEFDKYEVQGEDGLTKFEAILNKIRAVDGEFTIRAKNHVFIANLMNKDGALQKSFDAGAFKLK